MSGKNNWNMVENSFASDENFQRLRQKSVTVCITLHNFTIRVMHMPSKSHSYSHSYPSAQFCVIISKSSQKLIILTVFMYMFIVKITNVIAIINLNYLNTEFRLSFVFGNRKNSYSFTFSYRAKAHDY
uniref:Uncharacterized protein n=1 Tax=Glossina brevipalpis TaxID=37001 RepID=A0A1A9WHL5_9MUSC